LHTILPATADRVQHETLSAFAASRDRFERIVGWLEGPQAGRLAHGELEERLDVEGRELLRQMLQDHLDVRAQREPRLEAVVGADGMARGSVEAGHGRVLLTMFAKVQVARLAYRRRGHANLHPADAVLNLPVELHSHGLRRLAVLEGTRGSFDDVREAVRRRTGQRLGKRQLETLVQRAADDFDAASPCHGRGCGSEHDQPGYSALEGGEAQSQACGRGRQRLRHRPRSPHARRHHARRR
jgi:hypothetical protein